MRIEFIGFIVLIKGIKVIEFVLFISVILDFIVHSWSHIRSVLCAFLEKTSNSTSLRLLIDGFLQSSLLSANFPK